MTIQVIDKKAARIRRARKIRGKIREIGVHRLCIHRTPRHIYAQVLAPEGTKVIATASSLESQVRQALKYTGNVETAKHIGGLIAERATAKGIVQVAFDRSGFKYHGRVQALAQAAREGGLEF